MLDCSHNLHTGGVVTCQNHKYITDIVKDGIIIAFNVRHIEIATRVKLDGVKLESSHKRKVFW